MLTGEKLNLRPVTRVDLPLFNEWEEDVNYNTFSLQVPGHMNKGFEEDGLLSSKRGVLLAETKMHEVVGLVSYNQTAYGPNEGSRAFNIGITLDARYRGQGYGTEAQKMLTAYLFATYPIKRVEASTDLENVPEQHALIRAGFTREGVLRQAQWRNGDWHDLILYSKLRGE